MIGQNEDGCDRMTSKFEYKETTLAKLILYLKPHVQILVLHNYLAHWQDMEFKKELHLMLTGTMLTFVDFNENHSFKLEMEIQCMQWHNKQVTILVMITYRVNLSCDQCLPNSKLLKTFIILFQVMFA